MSAIIKQIINKAGEKVYPVTRSKAVYMSNGFSTIDDMLADMQDGDTKIEFNSDGTIKKTLASGNVVVTSFMPNGNIQDKCTDKTGKEVYTKTTSFKDDGSIEIKIDWGEE